MKVSDLIAQLEKRSPEQEVFLRFPSNDYWKNMQVVPVRDVKDVMVIDSLHHESLIEIQSYKSKNLQEVLCLTL